jgi:hypothetical protein
VGVKETAASAISSAATAISATVGSAGSQHASKVAQQLQEQMEDMRKVCATYRDFANSCARSCVTVSMLACVGDDSHDGGPFFDTALLGEVSALLSVTAFTRNCTSPHCTVLHFYNEYTCTCT